MESSSYLTTYQDYLQRQGVAVSEALSAKVAQMIQHTQWDDPQTPLDFNNVAVFALIEAEATTDAAMREMYLEMAIAALTEGTEHSLCGVHLALIHSLIGERDTAIQSAFSTLVTTLLPAGTAAELAPGLIFLPQQWRGYLELPYTQLLTLLSLDDSHQQSTLLAGEILCQSQLVLYNPFGLRFLQLATQLFPDSPLLNLHLGISTMMNAQLEGLLYLHRAHQFLPEAIAILQALFLAYQQLGQWDIANGWRQKALALATATGNSLWTSLPVESSFTTVPLENSVQLVVQASFQSIVTGVLLAKGTWFELEMEFWRDYVQPGMTVIDVGANVGVYSFSAAQRVGQTGKVIAIEPFSNCVKCLQETCRINQLDWVSVCRGAASDRQSTAYLSLHAASELNQLISNPTDTPENVEEVPCFTLDSLIEQEHLQRVDVLKIDAEGHELQVLKGSDRLLHQFQPAILYENIAGHKGSNRPVAEHLVQQGYQLFRYQPFVKRLQPLQLTDDLSASLNIIALPIHKT